MALRRKAFRHSERPGAADLGAYLDEIFFHNPWRDDALPSLVYLDGAGRIVGFLGRVPRPATFQGQSVRVAVGTQLMVDPAQRELAGVELVRAFLAGSQDLSFADVANEVSRQFWDALGGGISLLQTFQWTQPLRPSRFYANKFAQRFPVRGLAWGLAPVCWAIDGVIARWAPVAGLRVVPLTAAAMAAHLPELLGGVPLRPDYDERSAAWLLEQLAAKRTLGVLRRTALEDSDGGLVGWYLYYASRRGVGQVIQVAARKHRYGEVLQSLFHEAWRDGLTALAGRLEPALLPTVADRGAFLTRDGPWVLVHSTRPELVAAIRRGDAFLSRLEGEWWMSF